MIYKNTKKAAYFTFQLVLISIKVVSAGNDLDCFKSINDNEKKMLFDRTTVLTSINVRFSKSFWNELIMDSVKVVYEMKTDAMNGEHFWNKINDSCISSVEKWQCKMPYLRSNCAPNQLVEFKLMDSENPINVYISEIDITNGYFVLKKGEILYRFILNNDGQEKIKKIFESIYGLVPEKMFNCCN